MNNMNHNSLDSFLQQVWIPHANKELFAPSALEILGFIDDSLEAFFLLPIPMHAVLLPEFMFALDKSLQQYILKAKASCGIYLLHTIHNPLHDQPFISYHHLQETVIHSSQSCQL